MKQTKLQKQLQKRAAHERVGAVILAIATVIGMVTIERDIRGYQREATMRLNYAFANNTGRENETARMPVKYDDVLKTQTIGGN